MEAYGYLRALHALYGEVSTTNLPEDDPDNPRDPADDPPWSVVQSIRLVK